MLGLREKKKRHFPDGHKRKVENCSDSHVSYIINI